MAAQRPTLRQLEYFVALAQRLNFRAAAEDCFVTQPALSGQIAQLEGALGLKLFERDKRQVRLTEHGAALVAGAQETLASADRWTETAHSLGQPLAGPLRLGSIPTVGPYLLPALLPAVRRAHPQLQLFLHEDLTPNLIERLRSGELDLLLLAIDVDLGELETCELLSDPFLLAVPAGSELSGHASATPEDLEDRDVLLLEEGHCLRDQTLPFCERSGGREVAGFRATSLSTLVQMVVAGHGVTLVPELAVKREVRATPGLAALPFDAAGPSRSIGLAWRRSSARAAEFRALGETLVTAYARS